MENYHSFHPSHLQEDQNGKNHTSRKQLENCKLSFLFFLNKPNQLQLAAARISSLFPSPHQLFLIVFLAWSPIRAPCSAPLVVAVTIEEGRITTTTTTSSQLQIHPRGRRAELSSPTPRFDFVSTRGVLPSSCAGGRYLYQLRLPGCALLGSVGERRLLCGSGLRDLARRRGLILFAQ